MTEDAKEAYKQVEHDLSRFVYPVYSEMDAAYYRNVAEGIHGGCKLYNEFPQRAAEKRYGGALCLVVKQEDPKVWVEDRNTLEKMISEVIVESCAKK
ncbi:MAG: hypothetical protein KatS3mg024_2486 [Armatimonadota bacterium]|nr:MAG: hypothetical protein KatS3mg024_2486 [Armatimonadota bacterium]